VDTALRPRSASELVDAAFRLLRRHYPAFLTLAVAATAPQLVVQLFFVLAGNGAPDAVGTGLLALGAATVVLGSLLYLGYYTVVAGAFAALADEAVRSDAPDVVAAVRVGARRALSCLGVLLLYGLAVGAGMLLLVVPGVYVAVRLATAVPTCVVEGVGAREALRRAWTRGRGRAGHSLGVLAIALLVYLVPVMGASMVSGVLTVASGRLAGQVAGFLLEAAVTVLLYPLIPLVTQLLYYDLRVRADGYDLEQMVDALGAAPTRPAAASL